MLKVNHGYIETEKKILAGENGGPITIKIVDDGNRTTDKKLPETAVDL